MRRVVMAVVLSVSAVLAGDSDDVAIRSVIQSYMDARNHMDQAALRKLFTSDADQLVSTGQWRHGLDELLKGALASSKKENSRSSVTVESVRILGNDTAIVDGRYETTTKNDSSPRKMWSTFILQRTADGWRIAAIRNMLPAAP